MSFPDPEPDDRMPTGCSLHALALAVLGWAIVIGILFVCGVIKSIR